MSYPQQASHEAETGPASDAPPAPASASASASASPHTLRHTQVYAPFTPPPPPPPPPPLTSSPSPPTPTPTHEHAATPHQPSPPPDPPRPQAQQPSPSPARPQSSFQPQSQSQAQASILVHPQPHFLPHQMQRDLPSPPPHSSPSPQQPAPAPAQPAPAQPPPGPIPLALHSPYSVAAAAAATQSHSPHRSPHQSLTHATPPGSAPPNRGSYRRSQSQSPHAPQEHARGPSSAAPTVLALARPRPAHTRSLPTQGLGQEGGYERDLGDDDAGVAGVGAGRGAGGGYGVGNGYAAGNGYGVGSGYGGAPGGVGAKPVSWEGGGLPSAGGYSEGRAGAGMGGVGWIVPPAEEKRVRREMTVGERLGPTIAAAETERDKAAFKAKWTGYTLNAAIGVQVLLGALTTGLGAALTGKQTSVAISILGGASTLVASYLARARGSNEPENSLQRAKELDHFIREARAFELDHGHAVGAAFDRELNSFRHTLEAMLGSNDVGIAEDEGGRSANGNRSSHANHDRGNEKMGLPV